MNQTQLIGRWVRDPEITFSKAGDAVMKCTLAVTRAYDRENSDFIRIVAFKKTAELAGNYTAKGSQVAVIGRIQTGSYKKDDGTTVYTTDVIADRIQFLDSKGSGQNGNQSQQQGGQQRQGGQQQGGGYEDPFQGNSQPFDENSLPF